jgi:hypothetical protein
LKLRGSQINPHGDACYVSTAGRRGFARAGSFGTDNDGKTAIATGTNSFAEAGLGTDNDGNTATVTNNGLAQAGVGGTLNDGNTATATGGGTANAVVGPFSNIDGLTAIAGPRQTVTVPVWPR